MTQPSNRRVYAALSRAAQYALARPKRVIAACIVLAVLCAAGIPSFRHTMDYRFFFGDGNPQLAAFDALQEEYSKTDQVFLAIESVDGSVFSREALAAIADITEKAWDIPHAGRVDSLTNFQHVQADDFSMEVSDLFGDLDELDDAELSKRREFALTEPFTLNTLVSEDGTVAGVQITLDMPGVDHDKETPEVVFAVRALAEQLESSHPDLRVYLAGQVVVDQAFPESTAEDMGFVWPAFFVVMVVLLVLIFRNVWFVGATLLVGVLAIAAGMGVAGWTHMRVNAVITMAPIMILTLAMADCIHVLASYSQFLKEGRSKTEAMAESLRINFWPVLLTSVMTAIGFLTLHFNDSPPYRALGYAVAIGVGFAWLFSLVLLPCLAVAAPHRMPRAKDAEPSTSGFMARVAELVIKRRVFVSVSVGAAALGLCAAVSLNVINDDPVKYFGDSQTIRQHLEFVNSRIAGVGTIDYSVGAGSDEGVMEPAYMAKLDEFGAWLRSQPHVVHVDTVADIVKRLNKTWNGDRPEFYAVPDDRKMIAQLMLSYESSLTPDLGMENIMTFDRSATRVRLRLDDTSGRAHIELAARSRQWLEENAPAAMTTGGASVPLMFAHIGERSIEGILLGLVGSLVLMSLLLVVLLRSVRLGLMSLVSNVIPVAMAFGVWGVLHSQVDLGLSVTLGISFGIVVDDTIHFLTKYQWARSELGYGPQDAIRHAFCTVGRAVAITSVVLVAGFAMLGFSEMNITSNTSILTTVTVGLAFAVDFLLVPSLLLLIDRETVRAEQPADEPDDHQLPAASVVMQ